MIPPYFDPGNKSPGEKEIFKRLSSDPETDGWIVLHSLDISNHQRQLAGEADFVILVPNMGALVLEVKAHRQIYCHDGKWFFGTGGEPQRSPFKQASEAMHSLLAELRATNDQLGQVLFWSAVAFPYVPFTLSSPEWHQWQVINQQKYASKSFSSCVRSVLQAANDFVQAKGKESYFRTPTLEYCEEISEILRPNFEFFESPKQRLKEQKDEIKKYTEEQYAALDAMEVNPRMVFEGPAGTGKTMLAIEAARRSAALGHKVLFLCYNNLLGSWLSKQCEDLAPQVTCRTLPKHLLEVASTQPTSQASTGYWSKELPELATNALIDFLTLDEPDERWQFDELIIDEAQDILRPSYLDFLSYSLDGGFETGRWLLFGDFEKQAIFDAAHNPLQAFLDSRTSSGARFSLRNNCRNTPRIASFIELYAGLNPTYRKKLREDDGVEPEIRYVRGDGQQLQALADVLSELYDEDYSGRDIVVLSPVKDGCAASKLAQTPWKDRLKPFSAASPGHVPFTTIQSFKGLEAPAVIVTDISDVSDASALDLFYVGASRANNRLILLANERIQSSIQRVVLSNAGKVRA
jgi:hypothetical protein